MNAIRTLGFPPLRHLLRRMRRDRRGVAALELAIVMPVLLIILVGSAEAERVVRLQMDLSQAATTMAELAATQPASAQQSIPDYCKGAQLMLSAFGGAPLSIAVASVTNTSGNGSPTVAWQDTSCGNASAIAAPGTMAATLVPSTGDSAIVAVATYTYTNPLAFLLPVKITLSETGYARPRATTSGGG
jgi:Flp pilus assembly protein TadG